MFSLAPVVHASRCNRNFVSKAAATFYDVLNLKPDCSFQDIRNAYVKLSKKYHPDVKGVGRNVEQAARFIKITEAYQTLIKPKTRQEYDMLNLLAHKGGRRIIEVDLNQNVTVHRPWEIKPDYDPNPGAYYGIKNLKRLSNARIAFILSALACCASIFGFFSAEHSFTLNREVLNERSINAARHHALVKANAENFGNDEQLKRFVNRLTTRDN